MYRIFEIEGQRVEMACSALSKHFYKQVFGKDLMREMTAENPKKLKRDAAKIREFIDDLNNEDKEEVEGYQEKMDQVLQLQDFGEIASRLGFIFTTQATKSFDEYWGKTSFRDYALWLESTDIGSSPEFTKAVWELWAKNNRSSSIEKNLRAPQ